MPDRETRDNMDTGFMIWGLIIFSLGYVLPLIQGKEPNFGLALVASLLFSNSLVNKYDHYRYKQKIRPLEKQLASITGDQE